MSDAFPALFVVSEHGSLYTGRNVFNGSAFTTSPDVPVSQIEGLQGGKDRQKVLLLDSASLSQGTFNAPVVSAKRIPGTEAWLAETIRDVADLTDAFLGSMRKLVIPTHTLSSNTSLEDIYSVSDSCVPMIMCVNGKPVGGRELTSEVRDAFAAYFDNAILMDCDGSIPDADMSYVCAEYPGLCVLSPAKTVEDAPIPMELIGDYSVSPRGPQRILLPHWRRL